ncbi:MFS transporter [Candidatus Poribacteria bacterium]|nr:MFS transporter [Candidatus Poribacteria bacterium]
MPKLIAPTGHRDSSVNWRFGAYYFVSFAAVALHGIYGTLYLRRRGLSNVELGVLSTIPAWLGTVTPLLWGLLSDALRSRKPAMFAMHLATAFIYPLFWFWNGQSFLQLCLLMVAFTVFFAPAIPLADAWTMEHLGRHGGDYGRLRSWGSVGFVLPVLASTFVLRKAQVSDASALLPVFIGFSAFRLLSSGWALTLPDSAPTESRPKMEWRHLVGYLRPFALVFFFPAFVGRFVFGPYYTFFSIYLDEIGVSDSLKGI